MNIPEVWYIGAACASVGLLLGLIAGFSLAVYIAADLTRTLGETVHKSPKGK